MAKWKKPALWNLTFLDEFILNGIRMTYWILYFVYSYKGIRVLLMSILFVIQKKKERKKEKHMRRTFK